jgi:hypothetical protein
VSNAAKAMQAAGIGHNSQRETCPHCKQPWLHRSDADHRMLHAIVSLAYANWPEAHSFEPMGRDHLYGWLLIQADHCTVVDIESRKPATIEATISAIFPAIKRRVHCIDVQPTAKGVRIRISDSLSYKEAGKRKFEDVRSKVYEIIEAVLGTNVEALKREARQERAA